MCGIRSVAHKRRVTICTNHSMSTVIESIKKTLRWRRSKCVIFTQVAKTHKKALHRESLLIEWSRGARAWWGDERRRQAKTTAGNDDGGPVTTASPKSKVQGYVLDSELCKRAARAVRAGGKSGLVPSSPLDSYSFPIILNLDLYDRSHVERKRISGGSCS